MNAEYYYNPTDLSEELFITEVPVNILMESVESQFEEPLEYRKHDYVQSFIKKYNFSKENMYEEDQVDVDAYRDQFVAFLRDKFDEYLNIGFPELDDMEIDDSHELLHLTYRYFIKNIKKNFVNIARNYIDEHKKEFTSQFEKRKDVTSSTFKAEISDDDDVILLANLGAIVDQIFSEIRELDDVFEFFRLSEYEEPIVELENVKKWYRDFLITGNFIPAYCDMVDDDFKIEIQIKLRSKILKKYPKRTRRMDVEKEEDDIESQVPEKEEPEKQTD